MIAQRNLGAAQTRLAESVERLSSGQRINRAKDDAAGMAVAAVVDTQVKVAGTAHRNINDAISIVQTAEGALQPPPPPMRFTLQTGWEKQHRTFNSDHQLSFPSCCLTKPV